MEQKTRERIIPLGKINYGKSIGLTGTKKDCPVTMRPRLESIGTAGLVFRVWCEIYTASDATIAISDTPEILLNTEIKLDPLFNVAYQLWHSLKGKIITQGHSMQEKALLEAVATGQILGMDFMSTDSRIAYLKERNLYYLNYHNTLVTYGRGFVDDIPLSDADIIKLKQLTDPKEPLPA